MRIVLYAALICAVIGLLCVVWPTTVFGAGAAVWGFAALTGFLADKSLDVNGKAKIGKPQ